MRKMIRGVSFKLIFRSWWRNKLFSVISLLSLAVGIACTNLLITYVIYEDGIESGNPNKSHMIYMAQDSPMTSGEKVSYIVGDIPVQQKDRYPEIEDYLRMNIEGLEFITIGENRYDPIDILTVDPSFPRFFPYEVLSGDLRKALSQPGCIALSEDCAKRFFGKEDAIGKYLSIAYETEKADYEVAAVLKEYPQSYLKFDAITGNTKDFYGGSTLLLVNDLFDINTFADKLKEDKIPTIQNEIGQYYFYTLQESYFQEQQYTQETIPYINRNQKSLLYVGLFSAILILVIACFNYVNLSFSRILQQVRMIYTQKVMGASPAQIRLQLFTDTFLTVCIAFLLSLLLTLDLLPIFNRMVSGRLSIDFFLSGHVLPVIVLFILLLSIIPALYMSRKIAPLSHTGFKDFTSGSRKRRLVAVLSIAQFAISIGLVFATLTVRKQLGLVERNGDRYLNLIEVGTYSDDISHINLFAQEIQRFPSIEEKCLSLGSIINFALRQIIIKNEDGSENYYSLAQLGGDSTFLRVMRTPVLQGLSEREALRQYTSPVYINEQYAHLFVPKGENPVGKPVRLYDAEFGKMEKVGEPVAIIAGIIENLYTGTLRQEVYPSLTYLTSTLPYHTVHIRLKEENKAETLALLKQVWEKIDPNSIFKYKDLHEEFMLSNRKTIQLAQLLTMYSLISLLLTAFGLFGMALYAIERRTKEIGIRKVNGATTGEILRLLNRQFIFWVGIAFAISVPITWYSLNVWLENFVYRIDVSLETCLLSGCIVLVVTLLTVSRHSYKAASHNPVNSLRSE